MGFRRGRGRFGDLRVDDDRHGVEADVAIASGINAAEAPERGDAGSRLFDDFPNDAVAQRFPPLEGAAR